jgi:predicted amino acid dehydrogenase
MARSADGTNARQPINQLKIGSRCGVSSARAHSHEMVFSANVFRDVMPFGIGRQQAAINAGRHLEKAIDRATCELDLERAQMPAVAYAGDIAGADGCTLDPRTNGVAWSGVSSSDRKDGQDEKNWGARDLHRIFYLGER